MSEVQAQFTSQDANTWLRTVSTDITKKKAR